jgi:hypothetical protein
VKTLLPLAATEGTVTVSVVVVPATGFSLKEGEAPAGKPLTDSMTGCR